MDTLNIMVVKPVSMRDIAAAAGVSKSTFSLALREHPRLARKTVDHVLRVARELGYVMNPTVGAHMSAVRSRTHSIHRGTIAYLQFCGSAANSKYLAAVKERSRELNFSCEVISPKEEGLSKDTLRAGGVEGDRPRVV